MSLREEFLQKLSKIISGNKAFENAIFGILAEDGYVIPMALRQAVKYSNFTVDKLPRYSSADHGTNFKTLLTLIEKCLSRIKSKSDVIFFPYFDVPIVIDPLVEGSYEYIRNLIFLQNIYVSVESKYWEVHKNNGHLRISISESMRRSALSLISDKADFFYRSPEVQDVLAEKSDTNLVSLTLKAGLQEVEVLKQSCPEAWAKFEDAWGFSQYDVESFLGFVAHLKGIYTLWYQLEDFWDEWQEYVQDYRRNILDKDIFSKLVDFFAISVFDGLEWGISAPLIKIYTWYAVWPFYYHVLHPSLGFLSLAMRKYQTEWNNTLGADAAKVAFYLMNKLHFFPNIRFAALKKKKNLGDIDLAMYDTNSGHLFICEIKTVFDRFRTNYQLANFIEQKVNFSKANSQLQRNERAINSGKWKLSEIFGNSISGNPKSITSIILTWWDIVNPNLGTDNENILCCNFKAFRYLYEQVSGDLPSLAKTIYQLSKVFCVARLIPIKLSPEDKKDSKEFLEFTLEVQTDGLPPIGKFDRNVFCELAMQEIQSLAHFPEDWAVQNLQHGNEPTDYYFYP